MTNRKITRRISGIFGIILVFLVVADGLSLPCLAQTAVPAVEVAVPSHPPIPIPFTLGESGLVTLVIEDADGIRVRNLVSETPFPAGTNTVFWDGLDDLGRDAEAASHGVYHVPGKAVLPGRYTVRGLFRKAIDLRYEFSVYNPGLPPWRTASTKSQWLTNHTPPGTLCFIPAGAAPVREGDSASPAQILIGSYVAEGGSGLAWIDLEGRKLHGQMWVGGVWTGAEEIGRDMGPEPVTGVYAYVASSWKGDKYNNNQAEIRLHKLVNDTQKLPAPRDTRMGSGEDPAVLVPTWKFPDTNRVGIGGVAAWNGLVVVTLTKMEALLLIDAAHSNVLGTAALPVPRGLVFDPQGRLLVVSSNRIVRVTLPPKEQCKTETLLPTPEVIVTEGLEDPQQLALDSAGNLYVSDGGECNQVKVFALTGTQSRLLRTIGKAGVPKAGPYDPTLMHHPKGIAIDDRGRLWVAENDHAPKRVSVWTPEGKLVSAFYGPPAYGGGGVLDPEDKTLFYLNGMTFKLDWKTGESRLITLHWRPGKKDFTLPRKHNAGGPPDTPLYLKRHKYFTDAFLGSPTGGSRLASLWRERNGLAIPASSFGDASMWDWLKTEPLLDRVPWDDKHKRDPSKPVKLNGFIYVWSDLNGDGIGQPAEVQFALSPSTSGIMLGPDLSFVTAEAVRYAPQSFTKDGVPVYDLTKSEVLCPQTQRPTSSGGGQALPAPNGWTVLTTAPKPFAPQSVGGAFAGQSKWSYPSAWPGLHASHIAPMPEFPGELIGTTRVIGPAFSLDREDLVLWAINGNKGSIYLLTADGLFVATLFVDGRTRDSSWSMRPAAVRDMSVSDLTNGEESFWPSITRTRDGKVYLISNYPALIRVDGLDTLHRLPPQNVEVTLDMLTQARAWQVAEELRRQAELKTPDTLTVSLRETAPLVDGELEDWPTNAWAVIDVRQKPVGDWGRRALPTKAVFAVAGDRLYGAFRTGEPRTLDNAGNSLQNLFKTGGALDLMLGTDPAADPKRRAPVAGDLRLLISLVKTPSSKTGATQPVAVLYRPVVPGQTGDPIPFSSPLRTVAFDDVRDVTAEIVFAQGKTSNDKTVVPNPGGDFEFSLPLSVLGLDPKPGLKLRGDVGVLRGSGIETVQRVYWRNKATGLVSDIPSEAELTPHLWGWFEFGAPAAP